MKGTVPVELWSSLKREGSFPFVFLGLLGVVVALVGVRSGDT